MYPFLSAIIPGLDPAVPPELTVAQFDELVKENIGSRRFARMTAWDDPEAELELKLYRDMRRFQEYLNYRIAVIRAEKLKRTDSFEEPEEFYSEIDHALAAALSASPVEREKLLDAVCWRKLDELEICHEMDFEHLCIYRIRLGILQKYTNRDENTGRSNFEAALEQLAAGFNEV